MINNNILAMKLKTKHNEFHERRYGTGCSTGKKQTGNG